MDSGEGMHVWLRLQESGLMSSLPPTGVAATGVQDAVVARKVGKLNVGSCILALSIRGYLLWFRPKLETIAPTGESEDAGSNIQLSPLPSIISWDHRAGKRDADGRKGHPRCPRSLQRSANSPQDDASCRLSHCTARCLPAVLRESASSKSPPLSFQHWKDHCYFTLSCNQQPSARRLYG